MQERYYSLGYDQPRPSVFAASAFTLLAAVGLWLSSFTFVLLPTEGARALMNAMYYLPFVALPLVIYMARHRGIGSSMRLGLNTIEPLPLLLSALLALLSVFAAAGLSSLWELALGLLGLHGNTLAFVPDSPRELLLSIAAMALIPAICEETLFRGFVLAAWESRGTAFAIALSTVLFALMHGNVFGLPAYLLVGGLAGYLVFALDSIYTGIVYHAVYNAFCLIIPFFFGSESASIEGRPPILSLTVEIVVSLGIMAVVLAMIRLRRIQIGPDPQPRDPQPLEWREEVMLLLALSMMLFTSGLVLWFGGMS